MTKRLQAMWKLALTMLVAPVMAITAPAALAQDYGDTPYVQTPQVVVDRMLEAAKITAQDFVIDLGSGDGRMIITAAKRYGARGFGVDLDKRLVDISNRNAAKAGLTGKVNFYAQDLYDTDIARATVMTIYLLPEVNLMVRPRLLSTLKPGTRVVSHDYDMGEWPPDEQFVMDAPGKTVGRDQKSKVFYWVVPGKASGRWWWQQSIDGKARTFELSLDQNFQKLEGTLSVDGKPVALRNPRLVGERLSLEATVDGKSYVFAGRIFNQAVEGEVRVQGAQQVLAAWSATRTELWDPAHTKLPPPTLIPPQQ
jgi:hypothetical protein